LQIGQTVLCAQMKGRVMTTANAATLQLFKLDTDASLIEAAAKRMRTAAQEASIVVLGAVVCFYLHRAQKAGNKLRDSLSKIDIKTTEDRGLLKEIATNLGQAATALESAYEQSERRRVDRYPFGSQLLRQLEELACTFEDMAETAALGASEAFAAALRDELSKNLRGHRDAQRRAMA
jgi:hypothetical protein